MAGDLVFIEDSESNVEDETGVNGSDVAKAAGKQPNSMSMDGERQETFKSSLHHPLHQVRKGSQIAPKVS